MRRFVISCSCIVGALACSAPDASNDARVDGLTGSAAPPPLPVSWGGNQPTSWKPEAVLANAASLALNRAWQTPGISGGISDAVVAVPLIMVSSDFRESGDGQRNATLNLGTWQQPRPPVVAVLTRRPNGPSEASFFFDPSLPISTHQMRLAYSVQGQSKSTQLALQDNGDGKSATWTVDDALDWASSTQSDVVFVQPAGWNDWFPIYFRHPVVLAKDLLAQLRPQDQTLSGGRSALDPERVSAQISGNSSDVKATLLAHDGHFGAGFNQTPFLSKDFHGLFPVGDGGQFVSTGIGQGWAWVAEPPVSFIKSLYLCLDARDADAESQIGIPTATGPHQIGIDPNPNDPGNYAGTFINALETRPVLVGAAVKSPSASGPPSGNYAYGLKDVATIRWLMPGEGLVQPVAQSDWGYAHGKPSSVTANYHWFYNDQSSQATCLQGWVHPCLPHPNNGIGLNPTQGCERPAQ